MNILKSELSFYVNSAYNVVQRQEFEKVVVGVCLVIADGGGSTETAGALDSCERVAAGLQ